MGDSLDQSLTRAYDLIEQDNLDAAHAILKPLLTTAPNNADVWWLYSHAIEDPVEARKALQEVMRIDPNYPGVQELSGELGGDFAATQPTGLSSIKPLGTAAQTASPPPQLPDFPQLEEEPEWLTDQWDDDKRLDQTESATVPATEKDEDWFDDWEAEPRAATSNNADDLEDETKSDWLDDDWDDLDSSPEDSDIEEEIALVTPRSRRRLFIPLTILALVILAILAVILLTTSQTPAPVATATQAVAQAAATLEETEAVVPTATQEVMPTETEIEPTPTQETIASPIATDVATQEVVSAPDFDQLRGALIDFDIPDDGISIQQTALGNTLIVTICTNYDDLAAAMDDLSQNLSSEWADLNSVAVQLGDCDMPSTLRTVGVTIENALSYANNTLTLQEFQRLWAAIA